MIAIEDENAHKWLTGHINWERPESEVIDRNAPPPFTIKNFLPPIFDNYIGLTNVPGIIDDFPFDKINKPVISYGEPNEELYRVTSYSELTALFHQPNTDEGVHNLPWKTQGIAILHEETKKRLERIFETLSAGKKLNLFFEDCYRWNNYLLLEEGRVTFEELRVYEVTAKEFSQIMEKTQFDANLYLYTECKDWCFVQQENLLYGILAYNDNLTEKIDQLNIADTFKLEPDSPLLWLW